MSRSSSKGLFVEKSLLKKVIANNQSQRKKEIKTWSRESTIYPEFVGNTFTCLLMVVFLCETLQRYMKQK